MIRAIILDCFGVLYVNPQEHLLAHWLHDHPKAQAQVRDLFAQCDRGFLTQQDVIPRVVEVTGLDEPFVRAHIMEPSIRNTELLDMVMAMKPAIKVGLLSNIGSGAMDGFFSKQEREKLFDAVVLSGEVGMVKPFPGIYELMAQKLSVPAGECVMIDDSEANCAGADAAGMQAIHYGSNHQVIRKIEALTD